MIKVNNLSFSFPQKELYNKISFTLEDGQHCAFIGTSGSGKSTLLNILMDPERHMFDGEMDRDAQVKIGYVSQFSQFDKMQDRTVFEYVGESFFRLQQEISSICTEMEKSSELDALLEKYQLAMDAFDAIGGEDFESRINRKLNLANLLKQKEQLVSSLSGGEFKLIQVMKEMLCRPDLLIMDEPDAFLDFDNLHALKNLMNAHKGALLVITHNRYLLNHCFNKILHLENMELQEFDGKYIDYTFSLLQSKIEMQELNFADNVEIERNEILIEKFRKIATFTNEESAGRTLNARVKVQDRLLARRIKAPFVNLRQPEIHLKTDGTDGEAIALSVRDYSAAFDVTLFENVSFEIKSTEKVAIIGSNGAGKTTLMRDIFRNNHEAISLKDGMQVAYLSQLQGEMLDESNTIQQEFFDAGFKTSQDIIDYAAKYGFEGEILEQKISSLSGGEKNMLQLAKISAGRAGLLLLDEPTSHLDAYSQIALEKAIQNYKGAILMISHDFYAIANCMDYVLLIEDKAIRKMSIRKFRKMIYANHYDKDYLEIEQKKKALEAKVELALKNADFVLAKALSEELEGLIGLLKEAYAQHLN